MYRGRFLRYRTPDNLPDLLFRIGLTEEHAQWLGSLDGETVERAAALVAIPKPLLLRGAQLMAVRIASVGTSRSILDLRPSDELVNSAFMDLPPMVRQIRAAHRVARYQTGRRRSRAAAGCWTRSQP